MQVSIKGNKTDGYVINVFNKQDGFRCDVQLKIEEVLELQKVLNKKFK